MVEKEKLCKYCFKKIKKPKGIANKISQGIKIQRCLDYERTAQLEEAGFRVIRLWENKIRKMELNDLHSELFGGELITR